MSDGSPSDGSTGHSDPQRGGPFERSDGTGSTPPWAADHPERSLSQKALDALIFAPAGLLLSAVEDLPSMALKGRERLEVQLRNAHVVGRFAVTIGQRRLKEQFERLVPRNEPTLDESPAPVTPPTTNPRATPPAPVVVPPPPVVVPTPPVAPTAVVPDPPMPAGAPAGPVNDHPVDLAIPDYDTLSASQVVRRLDGLGAGDLESVLQHEAATRGRRTILHRAQQLLGTEDVPGLDGPA